jgi:hypothetical protein
MTKRIALILCLALTGLAGCDTERLNKLEKENAELKAKADKADVVRDFDLQAKCAKDARTWFNENWARDKDTMLLDFSNHYNAKFNKCIILVEYHYNSRLAGQFGDSWTNDMNLFDIYENVKYATFMENHYTYYKPDIHTAEQVIACDVEGNKCKTGAEFNNLIRKYMND